MLRLFDQIGRWTATQQIGASLAMVFAGVVGFGVAFGLVFMSQMLVMTSGMSDDEMPRAGALTWLMLLAAIVIGPAGAALTVTGVVLAFFVHRKPAQPAARLSEMRGE